MAPIVAVIFRDSLQQMQQLQILSLDSKTVTANAYVEWTLIGIKRLIENASP
jgi:hypothetical protein